LNFVFAKGIVIVVFNSDLYLTDFYHKLNFCKQLHLSTP